MTNDAPDQPAPNSSFDDNPFLSRQLLAELRGRLPEHQGFMEEVLGTWPEPTLAEKLKLTIEQRGQTLARLQQALHHLPVIYSTWEMTATTYLQVAPLYETEAEQWESTWWEVQCNTRTGALITYTPHKFADTYWENQRRQAQQRKSHRYDVW